VSNTAAGGCPREAGPRCLSGLCGPEPGRRPRGRWRSGAAGRHSGGDRSEVRGDASGSARVKSGLTFPILSTAGSRKGLTPPTSRRLGHCSMHWRDRLVASERGREPVRVLPISSRCYSKRSLTGIRHPGTAGSASAVSPRRKIAGCSGALAL